MAKKMCPHWSENLDVTRCPIIKSHDGKDMVCAGYYETKPGCEIIPKRKSKVWRVKEQAWLNYDTMEIEAVKANHEHGMYIGKQVPCTILIDEKYLREKP